MDDIVSIIMELRRAERAQTESKGGVGEEGGEGEFRKRLAEVADRRIEFREWLVCQIYITVLSSRFSNAWALVLTP